MYVQYQISSALYCFVAITGRPTIACTRLFQSKVLKSKPFISRVPKVKSVMLWIGYVSHHWSDGH